MDVDHLIERHRLRLVEHKRFLDEDSHHDASTHSHHRGEGERGTTQSVRTNNSDRSGSFRHQATREANLTAALARAIDASERTDMSDQQFRAAGDLTKAGILHDPIALDDTATGGATSTAMFFGYAGQQEQELVEDRLLAQHLDAAGRYYVRGPPDSMYQRSVWWLSNRERQLKEQEESRKQAALAECTFRPNTIETGGATPGGKANGRSRTPNRAKQSTVSPNHDVAALSHHLIRQQHARQLREEAQQRVAGPDISNWAPRQTVPKEFELGKRNKPIPSLRQPVGLADRQRQNEQHYTHRSSGAENHNDGHRSAAAQEESEFEPEARPSPTARSPPKDHHALPRHSPSSERGPQSQQPSAQQTDALDELRRRMDALEMDNQSLRRQLQEQNVTLQSRNRELEIAKNTVRRLTVQGVSS